MKKIEHIAIGNMQYPSRHMLWKNELLVNIGVYTGTFNNWAFIVTANDPNHIIKKTDVKTEGASDIGEVKLKTLFFDSR